MGQASAVGVHDLTELTMCVAADDKARARVTAVARRARLRRAALGLLVSPRGTKEMTCRVD